MIDQKTDKTGRHKGRQYGPARAGEAGDLPTEPCVGQVAPYWHEKPEVSPDEDLSNSKVQCGR